MKRIAILDTGVGARENDFTALHVKKSLDFTKSEFSELNTGLDDNGHGTTCAKIILKNVNQLEIYSLKVLDKNRCGSISDLYSALQYLLTQEIDIVNMSLAFSDSCYTDKIRMVCEELSKQGKIIVASVGRYEDRPFPALFDCVLGVQGKEFSSEDEFLYDPLAQIQITADDTPIFAEWKGHEIFILGGTSKAAALMSGKIAKWENNISQRLIVDSGPHKKYTDKANIHIHTKEKYIHDQKVLQEIAKLIPCDTKYKKDLYKKRFNEDPFRFGKHEYVKIMNSLIRQFKLQLPEYVSIGNIFDSIYTLEEFVERYRI